MASQDDVRRIVRSLPDTAEDPNRFSFSREGKGIAWVWLERIHPKRARIPNPDVLAVWVGSEDEKHALIDLDSNVFFTEPHYVGYPAVLVRLPMIDAELLEKVLTDAWRLRAPRRKRAPRHSAER